MRRMLFVVALALLAWCIALAHCQVHLQARHTPAVGHPLTRAIRHNPVAPEELILLLEKVFN